MSRTFLNGRLTISSLAVPTEDDLAAIQDLSHLDYEQFRTEVAEHRRNSPISDRSMDEIFEAALVKSQKIKQKQKYAV